MSQNRSRKTSRDRRIFNKIKYSMPFPVRFGVGPFRSIFSCISTLWHFYFWSDTLCNILLRRLWSGVCPIFFPTVIQCAVHTQCDSPGGSTWRGHRTFSSEYYEDGHTCYIFSHSENILRYSVLLWEPKTMKSCHSYTWGILAVHPEIIFYDVEML